jgi:predicted small lipoprotein YifL
MGKGKKSILLASVLLGVIIFIGTTLLTACGQKGPLHMPDRTPQENQSQNG